MPRREIDTSHARCDTCGEAYEAGAALYSPGSRFDENDDSVLVSFRHSKCHTPTDVLLKNLKNEIESISARAERSIFELRRYTRERR